MAKNEEKKDLLENAEVLAEKVEGVEQWIERNPKIVIGLLGAIALIVGAYFGLGNRMMRRKRKCFKPFVISKPTVLTWR